MEGFMYDPKTHAIIIWTDKDIQIKHGYLFLPFICVEEEHRKHKIFKKTLKVKYDKELFGYWIEPNSQTHIQLILMGYRPLPINIRRPVNLKTMFNI